MDYKYSARAVGIISPGPLGNNHFWSGPKDYGPINQKAPYNYSYVEKSDPQERFYFHEFSCICDLCKASPIYGRTQRKGPALYEDRGTIEIENAVVINRDTTLATIHDLIMHCSSNHNRRYVVGRFSVPERTGEFDFLLITNADYISNYMSDAAFMDYFFSESPEPLVQIRITHWDECLGGVHGIITIIPRVGWLGW